MVCAWPRIMSPRSAWFLSICWRSSGLASKTTPLPKIGVMKGYAAGCAHAHGDRVRDRGRLHEVRVAGQPEPHPLGEHERAVVGIPVAAHLAPGRAGADHRRSDARALELQLEAGHHALEPPLAR